MKPIRVELLRLKYTPSATFGKLRVFGVDNSILFECHTLEDVVRPIGVKVKHSTAIFEGIYSVIVSRSPKFRKLLPYVKNTMGFTGIRIHAGNTISNTSGCPIIGTTVSYPRERISGGSTIEKQLTNLLKNNEIPFEVKNGFQSE